ncbi:parathyroid hormone 4 [Festucalex cinctus]
MHECHAPVRRLLVFMLLLVLPTGLCEQNQSRRAVAEHQLMHDRGRNIQSLKRLIWLSGAMEGLHTARTRSPAPPGPLPGPLGADGDAAATVRDLLGNFFNNPYGTRQVQPDA